MLSNICFRLYSIPKIIINWHIGSCFAYKCGDKFTLYLFRSLTHAHTHTHILVVCSSTSWVFLFGVISFSLYTISWTLLNCNCLITTACPSKIPTVCPFVSLQIAAQMQHCLWEWLPPVDMKRRRTSGLHFCFYTEDGFPLRLYRVLINWGEEGGLHMRRNRWQDGLTSGNVCVCVWVSQIFEICLGATDPHIELFICRTSLPAPKDRRHENIHPPAQIWMSM